MVNDEHMIAQMVWIDLRCKNKVGLRMKGVCNGDGAERLALAIFVGLLRRSFELFEG